MARWAGAAWQLHGGTRRTFADVCGLEDSSPGTAVCLVAGSALVAAAADAIDVGPRSLAAAGSGWLR
jgi:hypothetical protein